MGLCALLAWVSLRVAWGDAGVVLDSGISAASCAGESVVDPFWTVNDDVTLLQVSAPDLDAKFFPEARLPENIGQARFLPVITKRCVFREVVVVAEHDHIRNSHTYMQDLPETSTQDDSWLERRPTDRIAPKLALTQDIQAVQSSPSATNEPTLSENTPTPNNESAPSKASDQKQSSTQTTFPTAGQPVEPEIASTPSNESAQSRASNQKNSWTHTSSTAGQPEIASTLSSESEPSQATEKKNVSKVVARIDKSLTAGIDDLLGNESSIRDSPFVKVTEKTLNETAAEISVEVASPWEISVVYMILIAPLVVAWAMAVHSGLDEDRARFLLPVTFVVAETSTTLANQSVTALTYSPAVVTTIQAVLTSVIAVLWTLTRDIPQLLSADFAGLRRWPASAALFVVYQLINHEASSVCSLTERTVFMNLAPLVALVLEIALMPLSMKPSTSFRAVLSLVTMLVGAILFGAQEPDITTAGLVTAILLVLVSVPYRMTQRYLLRECKGVPISALLFIDNSMLSIASTFMLLLDSRVESFDLDWLHDASVVYLLILSTLSWGAGHALALLVLRFSSAASTLVFHQLGGIIVIVMGILLFGDSVMTSAVSLTGLLIATASGTWYTFEVTCFRDRSKSGTDEDDAEITRMVSEDSVVSRARA